MRDEEAWSAHLWIRRRDVFEAALRQHGHLIVTNAGEGERVAKVRSQLCHAQWEEVSLQFCAKTKREPEVVEQRRVFELADNHFSVPLVDVVRKQDRVGRRSDRRIVKRIITVKQFVNHPFLLVVRHIWVLSEYQFRKEIKLKEILNYKVLLN